MQIQEMMACCDLGEYFIPRQVGLPEKRFETFDPAVDHCWFELDKDGFEATSLPATIPLTAQQLAANFASCQNHWDDNVLNPNELSVARPNDSKMTMGGMS